MSECVTMNNPRNNQKWKNPKYSRTERKAREKSLIEDTEGQLLITNFYKLINDISDYIDQNKQISDLILS